MNYNKTQIAGNLTRDPELRVSPKGNSVVGFTVAINRKWKQDGAEKEEVTFVDCKAFGATADAIAKYMKKGSGIFVDGRFNQEKWTDKTTGNERSKLAVIAESFQFVDGKREGTPRPSAKPQSTAPAMTQAEVDDVPF